MIDSQTIVHDFFFSIFQFREKNGDCFFCRYNAIDSISACLFFSVWKIIFVVEITRRKKSMFLQQKKNWKSSSAEEVRLNQARLNRHVLVVLQRARHACSHLIKYRRPIENYGNEKSETRKRATREKRYRIQHADADDTSARLLMPIFCWIEKNDTQLAASFCHWTKLKQDKKKITQAWLSTASTASEAQCWCVCVWRWKHKFLTSVSSVVFLHFLMLSLASIVCIHTRLNRVRVSHFHIFVYWLVRP